MSSFSQYRLQPFLLDALQREGFRNPTPIQAAVLPLALKGKNIIGRSETGSGKTHAFLLPILEKIDVDEPRVQAVILAPTRELALQIFQRLQQLVFLRKEIRVRLLSGGLERTKMIDQVEEAPHIVIGTPGRVRDIAFQQNAFNITSAKIVVLDEVDMILDQGFLDEVGEILSKMKHKFQFLAFSASLPEAIKHFLHTYMNDPQLVDLSGKRITSENVKHIAYPTRHKSRVDIVKRILTTINPYFAVVFCSKKEDVNLVYKELGQNGFSVGILHGDLDSTTRRVMMKRIRANEFPVVVASDIAARGMDLENVSHVINFDLPKEEEFYFHRAGRTGRYGNEEGICITLYDKDDLAYLQRIESKGVVFLHQELNQEGVMSDLKKPRSNRKKVNDRPLTQEDVQIRRLLTESKSAPVKPGYKKKVNEQIANIKRKQRRKMIQADIKRQIRERAIVRTKSEKRGESEE